MSSNSSGNNNNNNNRNSSSHRRHRSKRARREERTATNTASTPLTSTSSSSNNVASKKSKVGNENNSKKVAAATSNQQHQLSQNKLYDIVAGDHHFSSSQQPPVIVQLAGLSRISHCSLSNNNDDDYESNNMPIVAGVLYDGSKFICAAINTNGGTSATNKTNGGTNNTKTSNTSETDSKPTTTTDTSFIQLEDDYTYIISLKGYITSTNNGGQNKLPFLLITKFDVLDSYKSSVFHSKSCPTILAECSNNLNMQSKRIHGGNSGIFLTEKSPFLSNLDLAGVNSSSSGFSFLVSTQHNLNYTSINHISNFMSQHSAMMTLLNSSAQSTSHTLGSTNADSNENNDSGNSNSDQQNQRRSRSLSIDNTVTPYYSSALREFSSSQLDRQVASLTSNSGREVANRAVLVTTKQREALNKALAHAEKQHGHTDGTDGSINVEVNDDGNNSSSNDNWHLTPQLLQEWHKVLCGDGLHDEAGKFRKKSVRAGQTTFTPHSQIPTELDKVCRGITSLEIRLLNQSQQQQKQQYNIKSTIKVTNGVFKSTTSKNKTDKPQQQQPPPPPEQHDLYCLGPITFAAAVFFSIIDIHPFIDGNGRLARIACNWALRRSGIPFVINLFATQQQRREYVDAILETRRNVNLISRSCGSNRNRNNRGYQGDSDDEIFINAIRSSGAFLPLVTLIIDRLSKAIVELNRLVDEKSSLATEEMEAKAARRFREKAAAGTCIICFDDNPNIATLCCGKAVHLNCIAEWLSSRSSCPQCRGDLPSLPQRQQTRRQQRQSREERLVARLMNEIDFDEDDDEDNDEDNEEDDTTTDEMEEVGSDSTTTDEDDTTTINTDDENDNNGNENIADDTTTTTDDDEDDNGNYNNGVLVGMLDGHDDTTTEEDTTTITEEDDNNNNDHNDTTTTEDDDSNMEDTTTTNRSSAQPPHTHCNHDNCRNRAALDCDNGLCGRCCVLHGYYRCERHNT